MQSKTGFPSSHQLKSYVAPKFRLKLAARCPVSGRWPSFPPLMLLGRLGGVDLRIIRPLVVLSFHQLVKSCL